MTTYKFFAALKSIGRSQKTGLTSLTLVTDLIDRDLMKRIVLETNKNFRLTIWFHDKKDEAHDLDAEKVLQR